MNKLQFLALAVVSIGAIGAVRAQQDRLTITQDESSMELKIEKYLKTQHNLAVVEKNTKAGDDLWLELPFTGGPMPPYRVLLDTQPLNKSGNLVTERGIRIQMFTKVMVPAGRRPAALAVINDFNRRKVFSAVYVDTDGEVVLDWTLNVLSGGLDYEYVYDVLAREDKLWRTLYPDLMRALQ